MQARPMQAPMRRARALLRACTHQHARTQPRSMPRHLLLHLGDQRFHSPATQRPKKTRCTTCHTAAMSRLCLIRGWVRKPHTAQRCRSMQDSYSLLD